jgi:hypothetical protein
MDYVTAGALTSARIYKWHRSGMGASYFFLPEEQLQKEHLFGNLSQRNDIAVTMVTAPYAAIPILETKVQVVSIVRFLLKHVTI